MIRAILRKASGDIFTKDALLRVSSGSRLMFVPVHLTMLSMQFLGWGSAPSFMVDTNNNQRGLSYLLTVL